MNSPRVVALIVVREGLHVQSCGFQRYLPIGSPVESAREYDRWGIDEIALVLLDRDPKVNRKTVAEVSGAIAAPLLAMGGIRTEEDAKAYIAGGADKVGFNYSLTGNPDMVLKTARRFGQQCVVASIDLVRRAGRWVRWDYWKNSGSSEDVLACLRRMEHLQAGEIFLNFPEKDGMGTGMEVGVIQKIVKQTPLPVVVAGGIGTTGHVRACYRRARPSGIGIGNGLAHFEHSVLLFKQALAKAGAPVRQSIQANYRESSTDATGRPLRKSEKFLSELLFRRIEPEKI